ncbi:type VII secretion integral membrane protein EccD [Actinomadura sp. LD22]|uniref:Type VII secretion integral membrane protein EccD n=1 Tax=Actinomadura physcomitrii TaxID=2650748 RepID=A0A6I4M9Q5_9ACTN|nr:type VII secretion integral membrane protein EccD [Actinomadura physcomitrii]MWA02948.1 type VII secretion integral membrane protein EccD [Actinomadura physcomitrii]
MNPAAVHEGAARGDTTPGGYCRVTVAGPGRRADLVLPAGVPVAVLIPQLMTICVPDRGDPDPASWRLARLDGRDLPAGASLATVGIADGEVLMLHPRAVRVRPAEIEDVRGAVEDHVDGAWLWKPSTTHGFAMVLAALGPLAAAMAAGWATTWDVPAGTAAGRAACAAFAALLAVAGAWSSGGRTALARLMTGAGCAWGALAAALGAAAAAEPAPEPSVLAVLAATGLLGTAGLAWSLAPSALPVLSGSAVVVVAAGVVAAGDLLRDPGLGLGTGAVLLVLAAGALPRVAMTLGGLAGVDRRARDDGRVPTVRLDDRLRTTEDLLIGALAGLSGGACALLALLAAGDGRDRLLAAVTSLALLLRSRLFDRVPHALGPRLAGVAGLGAAAVAAASGSGSLSGWTPALALAAALAVAGLSAVPLTPVPRARLRRLLDWTELAVVAAMVVTAAYTFGLLDHLGPLPF